MRRVAHCARATNASNWLLGRGRERKQKTLISVDPATHLVLFVGSTVGMWKVQSLILVGAGVGTGLALYVGYKLGKIQNAAITQKKKGNDDDYLVVMNKEDTVLRELRELSIKVCILHGLPMMTSGIQTRKLLYFLCRTLKAEKAIDVGVFTGCSAHSLALGLSDKGKVIACDINKEYADIGRPYWKRGGVERKIDLRIGPAIDTLNELIDNEEKGTFDVIFIDADKVNYPNYYDLCILLLRKGGVIVVDNALWDGRVSIPSSNEDSTIAIRRLNEKMCNDPRVEYMLLNFADGIGIARKL